MKKNLPFIVAVIAAFMVSYLYFNPLLEGKRLKEHDKLNATGVQKEAFDFYSRTGEVTQWSNSMFGGMPTITFWAKFKTNVTVYIRKIERVGIYPASFLVILILGSFFCLILFGVNPWISILGALAYSFSTYFFILADVGHITKLWALAYMPPLIASIYLTLMKNQLVGGALTAIFLSLEISAVHPQITYYTIIVLLFLGIFLFVYEYKSNHLRIFLTRLLYLIIPLILAIGVNSAYLMTTQEYSKYSTRGANELTPDLNKGDTGLAKDYILDYSYDVTEALTAFIPRLKGGSMNEPLGERSQLFQELSKSQGKQQAQKIVQNIPLYWGSQPIVSGPFYFGAITIFLFVLGLFLVKGKEKWWLVSVVIISFLLSLGKYFPILSNFAIDHLPLYNKFRDVKNIVFIQCFAMWLLGMLALKEIFQDKTLSQKKYFDALKFSTIIAGGIALIFALIPTLAGSFTGEADTQLAASGWTSQLLDSLKNDRISVARTDSFRSLVFVLLAATIIWVTIKNRLKAKYALIIGSVLVLADLWPVAKRYLNNDDFVSKRQSEVPYTPTKANEYILKDMDLDYRVLNISVNPFSDASTSYFHKSIGGYSGAKMRRYQDMIENHISPEIQEIGTRLRTVKTLAELDLINFDGLNTINMLNTKYIIYNPGAAPIANKNAMGNAWFVSSYKIVNSANEEIKAIDNLDIKSTEVVDKQFSKYLTNKNFSNDPSASITLKSYAPNKLVYLSKSSSEQLAVFSEIYYPKGWISKIDGVETPHFRANYILRSMVVPSGNHEIVFEFNLKSYEIGNVISLSSSILLILAIAGVFFVEYRKRSKSSPNG